MTEVHKLGGTATIAFNSADGVIVAQGRRPLTDRQRKTVTATGPALTPQSKMGLSAGEDQRYNVGNYKNERFKGSIENLVLEIQ